MNSAAISGFGRRKRPTSIVGLRLGAGRLEAAHLVRANGSLRIVASVTVPLASAVPSTPPEALGTEIRTHLEAAGIRERHCVVAVPPRWILTGRTEIPELPDADAESLLQLEAERCFSTDTAALRQGSSRCGLPGGSHHVTLFGVSDSPLSGLEAGLTKAGLRLEGLPLGTPALVRPQEFRDGLLLISLEDEQVILLVMAGGGVAAHRTLEGDPAEDGSRLAPRPEIVAREIRITLGQLPDALRQQVTRARITGPSAPSQALADALGDRLRQSGLATEVAPNFPDGEPGPGIASGTPASIAVAIAARFLGGIPSPCDLLPPRPTLVGRLVARYSAGRLKAAGAVAGGIFALLLALVLYQQVQLFLLGRRWSAMSAKVSELDSMQQRIRQYRPWFDESFPNLAVLRQLSAAFPQDGSVTATSIEIREGSNVTCAGTARDTAAFLRMLETLNSAPGVTQLHRDQIRGTSPIQFTFGFQWNPAATP